MIKARDIDKIPAGAEMNALIAEVMGWRWWAPPPGYSPEPSLPLLVPPKFDGTMLQHMDMLVPDYSTDLTTTGKVIDRLDKLHAAWFEIRGPRVWLAQCNLPGHGRFSATASSASLAICRAALKAVMEDNDE